MLKTHLARTPASTCPSNLLKNEATACGHTDPIQGPAEMQGCVFYMFLLLTPRSRRRVLGQMPGYPSACFPKSLPHCWSPHCPTPNELPGLQYPSLHPILGCFTERGWFVGSVKLYSHQEALLQPLGCYHQEADISAAMKIKINQNPPKFDSRKLKIAPCLEVEAAF